MQAVVKYPNNPSGNLVLINELLSYKIAVKVGLDVPNCGICNLDETYSMADKFATYIKQEDCEFSEQNYGMCFFSTFIDRMVPLSAGIVPHISNRENFYTMVLFDHLVYNKDRHPGNLLVQTTKPIRYFAIDHSHVFKNQTIWDRYALRQGIAANDYLNKEILELNDDVYSYFFSCMGLDLELFGAARRSIEESLDQGFYHNIIRELPEEWAKEVNDEDLRALEEYLVYRTKHLEDIERLIVEERGN